MRQSERCQPGRFGVVAIVQLPRVRWSLVQLSHEYLLKNASVLQTWRMRLCGCFIDAHSWTRRREEVKGSRLYPWLKRTLLCHVIQAFPVNILQFWVCATA